MARRSNSYYLKLLSFFGDLTFFTPILPLFFLEHKVALTQVVLSQAAYSVAVVLFEVPTGLLADKYGHRKSVIAGSLTGLLGIVTVLLMPSVVGLYLAYLLYGLADAFLSGSREALLFETNRSENDRKHYTKHLSHMLSYGMLAFALGTATVGLLYGHFGKSAFIYLILASVVARFAGWMVSLRLRDVEAPTDMLASKKMIPLFAQSMRLIQKDSTLLNLTYIGLLTLPAQYVLYSSYQSHFVRYGVTPYMIGFVLTIGGLANALAMRFSHHLERFWSLDKAILNLTMLMGLTYAAFSLVHSPVQLIVVFVFLQMQFDLTQPIISDYINDRTETEVRATVMSGISLISSIGNTGSKVVLGLALTPFGVSGMMRIQATYLIIGSVVSYWLLVRCGCVYKLSHKIAADPISLELELEERRS